MHLCHFLKQVDDCASSDDDEDCDGYTALEVDQATSLVSDHGQVRVMSL